MAMSLFLPGIPITAGPRRPWGRC